MGSSDITSRLVAQATEDTGLVPPGVTATKPLTGEALPGTGAARPHAAATTAHAAATAMVKHWFDLRLICPPCRSISGRKE